MSGIIEKLREENAFLNDMLENAHNRSRLLEQQLTSAHREGWEQGKAEAVGKVEYLYKNSLGSRVLISVAADAIAAMEYGGKAND